MPTLVRKSDISDRGLARSRRLIAAAGVTTLIAVAGCSTAETQSPPDYASHVLQSVGVTLASNAAIERIESGAVFLNDSTGESTSITTFYETEDVINDLPVRVTTQYRTESGHGSDLAELEGFTGRVELEVSIENLTVESRELSYDAAGASHVTPALVGTPLSIAASTVLQGVPAARVKVASDDSATNGVLSSNSDGDAIVQWGTILAPPQSQASTTFRMVADVDDFEVPTVNLGVQAGLRTDLTFEGTLGSAFDTSTSSELGVQQRAIQLVTDVNGVLNRAGEAITDVRQNLDETSQTLGVETARDLNESTERLAREMEAISDQLGFLREDIESSLSGTHTVMSSQLTQIVASMNGILGDTSAEPPILIEGEGCQAVVRDVEAGGSIYSTLLQLSAQLSGYAEASSGCRDEIVTEIAEILGPDEPSEELCAETSLTCALFESKRDLLQSVHDLVADGEQILSELNAEPLAHTEEELSGLNDTLVLVDEQLELLSDHSQDVDEWWDAWDDVDERVDSALVWAESLQAAADDMSESHAALTESHFALLGEYNAMNELALDNLGSLGSGSGSVRAQLAELADLICELDDETNTDEVEAARALVTATPCPGDEDDEGEEEEEPPVEEPPGEDDSLDGRLTKQVEGWETVRDITGSDDSPLADLGNTLGDLDESLTTLTSDLDDLHEDLQALRDRVDGVLRPDENDNDEDDGSEGEEEVEADIRDIYDELSSLTIDIWDHHASLEGSLEHMETLTADLAEALENTRDESQEILDERIDEQVRIVKDRVIEGSTGIVDVYNTTITGLLQTSQTIVDEPRAQIEEQQESLAETHQVVTSALDEHTTAVIEQIGASTSASTRDIDAASGALIDSLNRVILDLGNPDVEGAGILGSMASSSAISGTADYQLALASQYASGFAGVRSADIAGIMLRQAQFEESLRLTAVARPFHLDIPAGATSETIYSFTLGGAE